MNLPSRIKATRDRVRQLRQLRQLERQAEALEQERYVDWPAGVGAHTRGIMQAILKTVSQDYKTTRAEILSHSRQARAVLPRHLCWYCVRQIASMSLSAIGRAFQRDHAAIYHGLHAIQNRIDTSTAFASDVRQLLRQLRKLAP
jgi:chromosomal replication initiation ATPase DnaA